RAGHWPGAGGNQPRRTGRHSGADLRAPMDTSTHPAAPDIGGTAGAGFTGRARVSTPQMLIIEDDDALRDQLQRALGSRGWLCHAENSVASCLTRLATLSQLDAALLDLNLGADNGLALIEPILARFPRCRVLILTGYGSIPAAVAASRRGAHNYLTKPASLADILAALEQDTAQQTPDLPDAPPSLERLEWEHIQR